MACQCNYSRSSPVTEMAMAMAMKAAHDEKVRQVVNDLHTKGVVFAIKRKEPELPPKDKRAIKFI